MYLLSRDGCDQLRLTWFDRDDRPPYAILSHTWGNDEVVYQDILDGRGSDKNGYVKLDFCLKQALADELEYCWVDTCCINRDDTAGLQNAIGSMFRWYRDASKCHAFLGDVPEKTFENSRWFTRGWTLQELIAPKDVEFFSSKGESLGLKISMVETLSEMTGIPPTVLDGGDLSAYKFEERLQWNSGRMTRYEEDMVYSLFGILDVSIPLRYGEGRKNALTRLHEQHEGGDIGKAARNCLRAWRLNDPHVERSRILAAKDTLLEGSCDWVFHDTAFKTWWKDEDTTILWIHGDPGKGKTMIMTALIDEMTRRLKDKPRQSVVSFFFCQGTTGDLGNATAVIRGLTFLLADENPSLRSHAVRSYEATGEKLFEASSALYSLWDTLVNMAKDPLVSRLYLAVDALDELDAASLHDFMSLLTRDSSTLKKVKWVLSSRNVPSIGEKLANQHSSLDTSLELNSSRVDDAVNSLIQFRVNQIAAQKSYSEQLQRTIMEYLRINASSTFLWVALVCKELEKVPARKARRTVEQFPTGLELLYQRMLQQIICDNDQEDVQLCEAILRVITIAFRPLDQREVGFIAGLDRNDATDLQTMTDLIRSCGSFLTMQDQKVYFVHHSTKDFFTTGSGKKMFEHGQDEAHRQLSKRLLRTVSFSLKRDICDTNEPSVMLSDISQDTIQRSLPLHVQYACCYWIAHTIDGRLLETERGVVTRFFGKQFLFWLEALGTLGKISDAIEGLSRLSYCWNKNCSKAEYPKTAEESDFLISGTWHCLREVMKDAQMFIRYSRPGIERAPLQVYSSALVFAPSKSLVRQMYEAYIPTWMKLLPLVEDRWSACLQTLEGHLGPVCALAVSSDGMTVASGSEDTTIKLWDTATGSLRHTLNGHSHHVNTVAFSPDGKTVASGSKDRRVKLWDTATGTLRSTLRDISDSTTVIASLDGGPVRRRDVKRSLRRSRTLHKSNPHMVTAVVFSPNGQTIMSGSADGTVELWDPITKRIHTTLKCDFNPIRALAISPDGRTIASVPLSSATRLWDSVTGALYGTLDGHSKIVNSVAFSPDGRTIASGSADNTVKLWNAATGSIHNTLGGHSRPVAAVAFSPDGKTVASGSCDKTVKLWNASTGAIHSTLDGHSETVTAVAFSPDEKTIISASLDSTVKLWDTTLRCYSSTLDSHSDRATSIVFSPDGKTVASGSFDSTDKTVKLWDAITGRLYTTIKGYSDSIGAPAISSDRRLVATGSYDETVKVWDATTGLLYNTFKGHSIWITTIAFSPDGRVVASGSADGVVKLWDATTGLLRSTLKATVGKMADPAGAIAFSSDMETVATGSWGGIIKLWNAKAALLLNTVSIDGSVRHIHFGEDESLLHSNRGDVWIRTLHQNSATMVWQGPPKTCVEESWISYENRLILWLPPEYRVHRGTSAVFDNRIALGRVSRTVTILEIDATALSKNL